MIKLSTCLLCFFAAIAGGNMFAASQPSEDVISNTREDVIFRGGEDFIFNPTGLTDLRAKLKPGPGIPDGIRGSHDGIR